MPDVTVLKCPNGGASCSGEPRAFDYGTAQSATSPRRRSTFVLVGCFLALLAVFACGTSRTQVGGTYGEELGVLRQRAEQGDAAAQCELGRRYSDGQGVQQDDAQAAAWYRRSAEQGFARGQVFLGIEYLGGAGGVPQDDTQAAAWFRAAAEQGDEGAQVLLSGMYERGQGVRLDYIEAHKWMNLAAASATGDQQVKLERRCDEMAQKMTPADASEAQLRARDWLVEFGSRQIKRLDR
jgi:TPR repeat protein